MIDSVHVQNFRCLHDTRVPLGPIPMIIGENDTGKSVFFNCAAPVQQAGFELVNAVSLAFKSECHSICCCHVSRCRASNETGLAAFIDDINREFPNCIKDIKEK